jgi:hypothetical protein
MTIGGPRLTCPSKWLRKVRVNPQKSKGIPSLSLRRSRKFTGESLQRVCAEKKPAIRKKLSMRKLCIRSNKTLKPSLPSLQNQAP